MIVEKGSICIDGISLTVAYVDDIEFRVSLIPHTGAETTLLSKKVGDKVNLENDIVGKYIEKLMQPYRSDVNRDEESRAGNDGALSERHNDCTAKKSTGLTLDKLIEYGI